MKKLLVIFLLLHFHFPLSAQYPNLLKNNKVTTIAYFKKGDSFKYHVTSDESHYKNEKEKPSRSLKSEYDITVTIIDSTEKVYTYELTYSGFTAEDEKKEYEADVKKIMDGVTVKYQTDELGIFDTIINLKELSETMGKTVDLLSEKFQSEIKDEELKEFMKGKMEMMKMMILQPENLELMFLEDILRLHAFYGFELELNKPIELEMEFPILDNLSLEGTGTITLKNIDKANNKSSFECIEKPKPGEITKFIEYIALNLFPEAVQKMKDKEKELKEIRYSTNIKVNYTMELSSGIMKSIKCTNKTTIKNDKKSMKTVSIKEYKMMN